MKKLLMIMCLSFGCLLGAVNAFAQTTNEIAKGNCKACADVCQQTVNYCASMKGKFAEPAIVNVIKDCFTACRTTGDYLTRGSALDVKSAATCIQACNECAKTCDQFAGDQQMVTCANECRKTVSNLEKVKQ